MRTLTISMLSSCLVLAHAGDTPACSLPAPAPAVVRVAQLPAEAGDALLSNGPVSGPDGRGLHYAIMRFQRSGEQIKQAPFLR